MTGARGRAPTAAPSLGSLIAVIAALGSAFAIVIAAGIAKGSAAAGTTAAGERTPARAPRLPFDPAAELAAEFPRTVGDALCRTCHARSEADEGSAPRGAGRAHAVCEVADIPEHARAATALKDPEAREIALLCGVVGEPSMSTLCLGCHGTSGADGPRWWLSTFDPQRGVQCEACHGPGSQHVALFAGRRGERSAGSRREHGASSLSGALHIEPGRRADCRGCHIERPSHRQVLVEGFRREAADSRYKTPARLAISPDGNELYVVCNQAGSVIVVDTQRGEPVAEIPVGHRPQGVARSPDGARLYVSNRLDDTLSILDLRARSVLATVPVGDDPHGVATDAEGDFVYVANSGDDTVSVLDAVTLDERARLTAGTAPWELAADPQRGRILVTHVRPQPAGFREPHTSELAIVDARARRVAQRPQLPGASSLEGCAWLPGSARALVTLRRVKNLVPITRLAQGWTMTSGLGVLQTDGRVDQVLLDRPGDHFPDPTDIAVSPDGTRALVASGGSNRVAVVDVPALLQLVDEAAPRVRELLLPDHLGSSERFVLRRLSVGRRPRAVLYSPDGTRAYVANSLDDTVQVIETAGFTTVATISLGGPEVITSIRRGERLFHDAGLTFGSQFSCSSCHPDGHIDGLTFDIEPDGIGRSPVDNRSLRGILDTAPFKWEGTNPTLRRQCGPRLAVFFTRRDPFTPEELDALVLYMSTIERPPNPRRHAEGLTLSQRRGKAIFERRVNNRGHELGEQQRCAGCHNTPFHTSRTRAHVGSTMWFDAPADFEPESLYDIDAYGAYGALYFIDAPRIRKSFDVAHLLNISASPPYLHNGAAASLEEIWTVFNLYERHGSTGDLTRRQFNDLIAYLRVL